MPYFDTLRLNKRILRLLEASKIIKAAYYTASIFIQQCFFSIGFKYFTIKKERNPNLIHYHHYSNELLQYNLEQFDSYHKL